MREVSFTDFSQNLQKYLGNTETDNVAITKNGVPVLRIVMDDAYHKNKLVKPENNQASISQQLLGIAAGVELSLEELKAERLAKYEHTA
ncbi:antitoxin phd [Candidatus Termititenax aidoneus]|uniref:Antitoxin phd n=1 Tax=Termititenax aidoneus TaxID=2218524 RepID=A0A388TE07_TERA1|nr:antitoxin phd [Candidatus Termititenax aidoneus]